jgi:hypothetical protein
MMIMSDFNLSEIRNTKILMKFFNLFIEFKLVIY